MARIPLTLWAGFLIAALVTAGIAVSQLVSSASTNEVADLHAGTQVDSGPFLLTVERARVLDELPGVSESDDSTRVIALVITAAANSSKTLTGAMLADSVALRGVDGLVGPEPLSSDDDGAGSDDAPLTAPNVFVLADGSRLDALQPGLEYEIAMVWEQSSRRPAPTEVEVVVASRTLRESTIDRSTQWLDRETVAAGRVPITPPDETPAPEPTTGGAAG